MATVTISDFMPSFQYWGNIGFSGDPTLITAQTKTTFNFDIATDGDFAGWTAAAAGSKFKYLPNGDGSVDEPTAGTVTSFVISDNLGHAVLSITGADMDLTELYFDLFNTSSQVGPSVTDFFSQILRGGDTINGSNGNDDIASGTNAGNDTIFGNGGNDYIKGDAGNDTIDGGAGGFDTMSYNQSFFDPSAYKGINLNSVTGVVKDCWGGTDQISNFEEFHGSRYKDTFTGNAALRETFMGLRGADVIDGGGPGSRDTARYDQDAQFGGSRGIVADLAAGTIRDGFGQTDTVSNIQRIVGTNSGDKFIGSALINEQFTGLGGKDSFDGGGGEDLVDFSRNSSNGGLHGVNVNLSKLSGQIIDDGYGNKENAISIESIRATNFDDIIKGTDAVYNFMHAGLGADTLKGGTGADGFGYYDIGDFGDILLDFTTGEDEVYVGVGGIQGLDNTIRFNVGTAASGAGASFYFNPANRTLNYDQDGNGGAFSGDVVFTVQAGGSVAAGDLILD